MQNEFWHYFNLANCSLQHMKLCTFIILAAFKFGAMDPIRRIAKLKSSSKFQHIRYFPEASLKIGCKRRYTVERSNVSHKKSLYQLNRFQSVLPVSELLTGGRGILAFLPMPQESQEVTGGSATISKRSKYSYRTVTQYKVFSG